MPRVKIIITIIQAVSFHRRLVLYIKYRSYGKNIICLTQYFLLFSNNFLPGRSIASSWTPNSLKALTKFEPLSVVVALTFSVSKPTRLFILFIMLATWSNVWDPGNCWHAVATEQRSNVFSSIWNYVKTLFILFIIKYIQRILIYSYLFFDIF